VYQTVFAPAVEVRIAVPPTLTVDAPETAAVGVEGTAPPATVATTWSEAEQPFELVAVKVYVVVDVVEQLGFNTLVADKPVAGDQTTLTGPTYV
jgi:hypothetical protein